MNVLYPHTPLRFSSNNIEDFIKWAIEQNVSDITIQTNQQIFCDIYNKKHKVTTRKLSRAEVSDIISHIYNEGGLSRLNAGKYLDFTWAFTNYKDSIRLRGNVTAILSEGHKGYEITLRIINENRPRLYDLDLPQDLIKSLEVKKGMILVSGPTGSGKSMLLACFIDNILENPESHIKIVTYEDPIEYTFDKTKKPTSSISQSEVGIHIESFAEGIRSALRRKADAIFIGELRDLETTQEALRAAQKGHLLLSTTHSNSPADTIYSLINEFPTYEKLARSIQLINMSRVIISQRLISSLDGKRIAIREYLILDEDIRNTIIKSGFENVTQTINKIIKEKKTDFKTDLNNKLSQNLISEEVYKEILNEIY